MTLLHVLKKLVQYTIIIFFIVTFHGNAIPIFESTFYVPNYDLIDFTIIVYLLAGYLLLDLSVEIVKLKGVSK